MPTASLVTFSEKEIITLFFGSSLLTALLVFMLGWVKDWIKETRTKKMAAQYSALRLAVLLESFAIASADNIAENASFESSDGHMGHNTTEIPPIGDMPEDIDWQALDPSLSAQILTLPNELVLAKITLSGFWEVCDPEDFSSQYRHQAGYLGYRAWEIAQNLRIKYALSTFEPKNNSWNIKEYLQPHFDAVTSSPED